MGLGGLETCLGSFVTGLGTSVWRFEGCWVVDILEKGRVGVRVDKGVRMMLVGEKFVWRLVEVIVTA